MKMCDHIKSHMLVINIESFLSVNKIKLHIKMWNIIEIVSYEKWSNKIIFDYESNFNIAPNGCGNYIKKKKWFN